ncbi:MAG: hypothetical protein NZL90_02140 [Aquificaceae bacterium]|nr:hypothetical protein [Aquificaceae bacterium]MDW8237338.1 hypothetical protein [Aquificaceae bacterium]
MEKCLEFFQDSRFINCFNDFLRNLCGIEGEQFVVAKELTDKTIPEDEFGVLMLYCKDKLLAVSALGFLNSKLTSSCSIAEANSFLERARSLCDENLKLIMLKVVAPNLSPVFIRDLLLQAYILMCKSLPEFHEKL